MSSLSFRTQFNNAKQYTRHNRFELVKYSLVTVSVFSALVLMVELFLDRDHLYDVFEEEWGSDPIALSHGRLIVDTLVWLTVAAVIVFLSIYLWIVITDKMIATLVMTVLSVVSFIWELVEYEEPIGASVFHMIINVVELALGFTFVYLLWKRRRQANSEVRYIANEI